MCNEELPFSLFCSNYPSLYRSRQVKAVISAPVMRPKIYWAFFFTAFRAHACKQQLSFARHLACPRPSLQILINHPNADDKWGARARRCVCVHLLGGSHTRSITCPCQNCTVKRRWQNCIPSAAKASAHLCVNRSLAQSLQQTNGIFLNSKKDGAAAL